MADISANLVAERTTFAPLQSLWTLLVRLGENSARSRMLQHYAMMSDAQLEQIGLKREDIAHRLFPNV